MEKKIQIYERRIETLEQALLVAEKDRLRYQKEVSRIKEALSQRERASTRPGAQIGKLPCIELHTDLISTRVFAV